MSTYKLVYFDLKGRAEVARMIFAYAGQEYEDKRITPEFWAETVKAKTPMGQLPVLAVDGKHLCQSGAINRFLANKFGVNGSDAWEAAQIDQYASGIDDLLTELKPFFIAKRSGNAEAADKLMKELNETKIQPFLKLYGQFLKKSDTDWMVGSKPSYLDFMMQHVLTMLCKLGGHANVVGPHEDTFKPYLQRVCALPPIRKWLDTRPQTEY